jgi:hypothetical protein
MLIIRPKPAEQFCPILGRGVGEERVLIGAGIVDHNIERTVLRHNVFHHARVGNIDFCRGSTHLPRQFRCVGDIEIADYNMGASSGKAPCDRRADAVCSARYESAAAVQPSEGQSTGRRHLLASREFGLAPFDHRGEAFARVGHS